jgi:hypothetical protein
MDFWGEFIVAALVFVFVRWGGQKAIERYLGRTPEPDNKIFAAGMTVAALVLLVVLPSRIWPIHDPILFPIGMFAACVVGDLAAQALFGKRSVARD